MGGPGDDTISTVVGGDGSNNTSFVFGDDGLITWVGSELSGGHAPWAGANSDPRDIDLVMSTDPTDAGNDTITIGSGRAIVVGGGGNDTITGGSGTNVILGDNGEIDGVSGNPDPFGTLPMTVGMVETTYPGAQYGGDDTISVGSGSAIVMGGTGADDHHHRLGHELRLRRRRLHHVGRRDLEPGGSHLGRRERRPERHRPRRLDRSGGRRQRRDHRRLRPGDRRRRRGRRHDHRRHRDEHHPRRQRPHLRRRRSHARDAVRDAPDHARDGRRRRRRASAATTRSRPGRAIRS